MPSDITVKKQDGTTDIIYSTVAGASSNSPAIWRGANGGYSPGAKPEFRISSGPSGSPANGRRIPVSYSYPSLTTGSDGIQRITGRFNFTGHVTFTNDMLDVDRAEGAYQLGNLMAHVTTKTAMFSGFAPV